MPGQGRLNGILPGMAERRIPDMVRQAGSSPGSTGGGIKTSTFFVLMQQVRGIFTKKHVGAFKRSISNDVLAKASMIALVSLLLVCGGTFLLCVLEPDCTFIQLLFEQVSAFGTVGLSTGITPGLCDGSKLVLIFTMFAGRVGMFTLLSIWIEDVYKRQW